MKRFKDLVREGVDPDTPDSPSMAAATYKRKPNKEPMPKLKEERLEEGRPSQRHPLEDHEYHKKSNAELIGIAKDAHAAAEAMKGHSPRAENKYRDQANDSATVRYFRQKSGMPDWYKKKYGHMKEETDTTEKEEMVQSQLHFIKYACKEILEYIEMGGEVEEWYQVKIAKSFSEFESLHSFIEGESRRTGMKEEVELDEEYTPKFEFRKKVQPNIHKHFDDEKTAGGHTAITYHKQPDGSTHAKVSYRNIKGDGVGKTQYKHFAVNKDHSVTRIKKVNEGVELDEGENEQIKDGDPCWKGYEMVGMKKKNGRKVPNCVPEVKEETDPPFDPDPRKKKDVIPGKHGEGYSKVRHLARQAMKKQIEKMKPVKESLDESRKAEIVKEIMNKKKKNGKDDSETFQKEPILSSEIVKA
jgi:hypothetical protein